MIYPPKKTAPLLPHCQRQRNIMGARVPSGITPFLCVICDFNRFIASAVRITSGETTCKHKYSALKKKHSLQGANHLSFLVQNHSTDGKEWQTSCMCDTFFKCSSDVRHVTSNAPLRCLVWAPLTRGDTKWKMTRGLMAPEVVSVQNVCLGQTLTELRHSVKK